MNAFGFTLGVPNTILAQAVNACGETEEEAAFERRIAQAWNEAN